MHHAEISSTEHFGAMQALSLYRYHETDGQRVVRTLAQLGEEDLKEVGCLLSLCPATGKKLVSFQCSHLGSDIEFYIIRKVE